MRHVKLALVGLGIMVSSGSAQIFLPPPEKPEGFSTVPPPPDLNRERLLELLNNRNTDKMGDQDRRVEKRDADRRRRQDLVNAQYRREQIMEELAGVQYESMVWRDADNLVVRLDTPPAISAFNHNPLIDTSTMDTIWLVIDSRRERIQQKIIENPVVIQAIAAGEIDRVSLADLNGIQRMQMMLQQMNLQVDVIQELGRRGVINERQAYMNGLIVKEYNDAVRAELGKGGERMQMQGLVGPMLRSQADEALYVYEEMLIGAAPSLEAIASRLKLSESQSQLASDSVARLASTTDRNDRLEIMNSLVTSLELNQLRAFLALAAG